MEFGERSPSRAALMYLNSNGSIPASAASMSIRLSLAIYAWGEPKARKAIPKLPLLKHIWESPLIFGTLYGYPRKRIVFVVSVVEASLYAP